MKFTHNTKAFSDHEEKILPMINVVFLLLIFFMIAGSLSVKEPFELAAPLSNSNLPVQQHSVIISMSSDGALALDAELLSEEKMIEKITALIRNNSNSYIEIKADQQVAGNRVITLLNRLKDIGVTKVNLITEKREL